MTNQIEIEIENITETYNGTKYAYEKENIYDTEYVAYCMEYGEEFCSSFYAPKNYTIKQLFDIGRDIAMWYGGKCLDVVKASRMN